MPQSFAIKTKHSIAGLLVSAERGFRFYASDRAFVELEARQYRRIEDARHGPSYLVARYRGDTGSKVDFLLPADADRKVSSLYDMIHPNASDTLTVRSVYVLGPDKRSS